MLEGELVKALGIPAVEISTVPWFADVAWDADMTMDEVRGLDPAVILDHGWRRIVVQRIRGELRYCLVTDFRPEIVNAIDDCAELGWVESFSDAVALCREHLLGDRPPSALSTRRWAHGKLVGT